MKMHSEADMDEQIQEMKTITRLQGQPAAGVASCPPTPTGAQGLLGAGLSVLTQGQSRANRLVASLLPTPQTEPGKGSKGPAMQGAGESRN